MRWFLCLLVLLSCSCTDEMSSMRLFNEETRRFDKRIFLDWAIIGGKDARSERLLLVDDGHARRNKGGNLYTRALLTKQENVALEQLRERWGRIDIEWQSSPMVTHPDAHRLRFDGHGKPGGDAEVRAFAERVLARLAPETLAREATDVVEAVVIERDQRGMAKLEVRRALFDTVAAGASLEVLLPEAREGAGGVPTVFAIADGSAAYLKVRYDDIASRMLPTDGGSKR